MKTKSILYWTTTVLLSLGVLSGGLMQALHQKETVEGVMLLGYPLYFVALLGIWKVLGGIAILVPRFPRLKEWAYAGIFFEMTGASISHAVCGDYGAYAFHFIVPLIYAALTIASWALRPASRMITQVKTA